MGDMNITAGWFKIAAVVAFLWLASKVTHILLPLLIAAVLAFVLNPLVTALSVRPLPVVRRRLPRGVAVVIAFAVAAAVVVIITSFILGPFVQEFTKFSTNLPGLLQQLYNVILDVQHRASAVPLPEDMRQLVNHALQNAMSFMVDITTRLLNETLNFASRIVELVVVPILTYYFLKDWPLLRDSVVGLFPPSSRDKVRSIVEDMGRAVSGYIQGQVLVSFIVGLLVFAGMYFLGLGYPLVLGILATVTETIPIIGPVLGALPAVALAFLQSPALALKVVLYYVVVQQVENHLIVPQVMGHVIDIHPVTVIVSILAGAQLLGVAGMMLAVPVAALIKVLFKHLWEY